MSKTVRFFSDVQTYKKNLTDYVDKAVAGSYGVGKKSQEEDKCKSLFWPNYIFLRLYTGRKHHAIIPQCANDYIELSEC